MGGTARPLPIRSRYTSRAPRRGASSLRLLNAASIARDMVEWREFNFSIRMRIMSVTHDLRAPARGPAATQKHTRGWL